MKAKDSSNLNDIIQAVNEAVTNLEVTTTETDTDINILVRLPKVGTIGRPRKVDPLQAEMAADRIVEAQINRQEVEKAGGND